MVTIVKHEWHQVDVQYAIELDEDLLSEIYPDLDEDEIAEKLREIEEGEIDIEDVMNDAWENDVDIEWDHQYDDNWTMRKGGYDVTYEIGDEDSWHHEPEPDPPTHKCTKCKWTGQSYDADWKYDEKDEDGEAKKVCPYCESNVELTEEGIRKEEERKEWQRKWDEENPEEDDAEIDFSNDEEPYHAECTSCTWEGPEEDTITIEGVMCCPDCREPVWTAEQVEERRKEELEDALQELKNEFEELMNQDLPVVKMKCVDCGWEGDWTATHSKTVDGIDIDLCPECEGDVEEVEDESK